MVSAHLGDGKDFEVPFLSLTPLHLGWWFMNFE